MDLTTLPAEMVSSILKHLKFEKLRSFRKLNSKIDKVAKRSGLNKRIPLEMLRIIFDDDDGEDPIWRVTFQEEKEREKETTEDSDSDDEQSYYLNWYPNMTSFQGDRHRVFPILNRLLQKVSVRDRFELQFLTDELHTLIEDNKEAFRKCKSFHYSSWISAMSREKIKKILSVLPRLEKISTESEANYDNLFNLEVLGNRKWKDICYNPSRGYVRQEYRHEDNLYPNIDDQFLEKVVQKCERFVIPPVKTSATLRGVINLLNNVLAAGPFEKVIEIGAVHLGDMPLFSTKDLMDEVPNLSVGSSFFGNRVKYTVNFDNWVEEITDRAHFHFYLLQSDIELAELESIQRVGVCLQQ